MRLSTCFCLALSATLPLLSQGQEGIKIVSRWRGPTDVVSTITYVDGNRQRREDYWGVCEIDATFGMTEMSLQECGDWSAYYYVFGNVFYDEPAEPEARSQPPITRPAEKGIIRVQIEHFDTGERQSKFGLTLRHIVTTEKYDFTHSRCSPQEVARKYDGWYSDWPYSNKCSEIDTTEVQPSFSCGDPVVVTREGTKPSGFVMSMVEETEYKNEPPYYSYDEVLSIEHQKLDSALFVKPTDVRPLSELKKHSRKADQPSNPPDQKPTPNKVEPLTKSGDSAH
jgi:hypothetical protein